MKAPNQKQPASRDAKAKAKGSKMFAMFRMIAAAFSLRGRDSDAATRAGYHYAYGGGGNPEYTPRKHRYQTYAAQRRTAQKRRRAKQ